MNFLVFNDPRTIPWYTNLFDLLMLTLFVLGVITSVRAARRGRRDYLFVISAAVVYGLMLELGGMGYRDMYAQGRFAVMLDWGFLHLTNHTLMPAYVPIFYPVFFFLGYRLVEGVGIVSPVRRAIAGGLVMGALLDPPYIIQGNLDQSRWWTWTPWELYHFWLGWPLIDLWWQTAWGAAMYYVLFRLRPRIDSGFGGRTWLRLVVAPVLAAVTVLVVGPFLHVPLVVLTDMGVPQGLPDAVLVVVFALVALTSRRAPAPRADPIVIGAVGLYVLVFGAMQVGNVVHEGGIEFHVVVQSAALVGLVLLALAPLLGRRPQVPEGAHLPAATR